MSKLKFLILIIILSLAVIQFKTKIPEKIRDFKLSKTVRNKEKNPSYISDKVIIPTPSQKYNSQILWKFQCIDTMKTSRDNARSWAKRTDLVQLIDSEMEQIKGLGANCVAIDTPYDEEFRSYLSRWVKSAREENLIIWFRGNFSAWEGWFGYAKFSDPSEHHLKIKDFVLNNSDIFQDGDIFTPVPEPENGALKDPRGAEDLKNNYLSFLVESQKNCRSSFELINKQVECGYFSTNADIARDILNTEVVKQLGNRVVIDHYVPNTQRMGEDIKLLYEKYGTRIVIGEFGAPIPSINGRMSEEEQADFVRQLLSEMYINKDIIEGVNYWVLANGTTALYNIDGSPRLVVETIKDYFLPGTISGTVTNSLGDPMDNAQVNIGDGLSVRTDSNGKFNAVVPAGYREIKISYHDYKSVKKDYNVARETEVNSNIIMEPLDSNWMEKFLIELRLMMKAIINFTK